MSKKHAFIIVFIITVMMTALTVRADIYSRSTGVVIFKAPKANTYQWYCKKGKGKKWKKMGGKIERRLMFVSHKHQNGYQYKCRLNKKKWSKKEKLIITDIGKKYWRHIDKKLVNTLFMPKCADGYCYVHCTSSCLSTDVKKAISIANKKIGRLFIYAESPHVADIIVMKWSGNKISDSMWFKSDEMEEIGKNGDTWAGVTFSEEGLHYLVCLNTDCVGYEDDYSYSVIIHELGHCIGIPHQPDKNSIMYDTLFVEKMSAKDIAMFKKQRWKIKQLAN